MQICNGNAASVSLCLCAIHRCWLLFSFCWTEVFREWRNVIPASGVDEYMRVYAGTEHAQLHDLQPLLGWLNRGLAPSELITIWFWFPLSATVPHLLHVWVNESSVAACSAWLFFSHLASAFYLITSHHPFFPFSMHAIERNVPFHIVDFWPEERLWQPSTVGSVGEVHLRLLQDPDFTFAFMHLADAVTKAQC